MHGRIRSTKVPLDIDAPIELGGSKAASNEPSQEQIGMIADMGFSHNQARKALRESVGFLFFYKVVAKRRGMVLIGIGRQPRAGH